jgi:hypothetical protein
MVSPHCRYYPLVLLEFIHFISLTDCLAFTAASVESSRLFREKLDSSKSLGREPKSERHAE